jgi:hypothetical protein
MRGRVVKGIADISLREIAQSAEKPRRGSVSRSNTSPEVSSPLAFPAGASFD